MLVNEVTNANFTVVFVDRQSYRRGYDSRGLTLRCGLGCE